MECEHPPDKRVNDRSTGDEICTECGRVLDALAFDDASHAAGSHPTYYFSPQLTRDLDERIARKVRRLCDHASSMAHAMKLSDRVIEVASLLLGEACVHGYRVRDGMVRQTTASALYYACKLENVDRAEVEIAANCGIALKHLTISNKRFRRALATTAFAARLCAPANPLRLIPRFVDVLCAEPTPVVPRPQKHRLRTRCEEIGERVLRAGALEGKSPECCCITFMFRAMLDLGYDADVLSTVCVRCGLTPNTIMNALAILDASMRDAPV